MKEPPKVSMIKPQRSADEWAEGASVQTEVPKKPTQEVKRVTVDLPIEIHEELKILCTRARVNIGDTVKKWIMEKLKEGKT